MKKLLIIPFVILTALTFYFVYIADQWLGLVAFTYRYLLFCVVAALVMSAIWFGCFKKHAWLAGFVIFSLFATNFILPPPSERLLRSALLKLPPGTSEEAIEPIVNQTYENSRFVLPKISRGQAANFDRVHVSLLSQKAGNCSAIIFLIEDGVVVKNSFSAD